MCGEVVIIKVVDYSSVPISTASDFFVVITELLERVLATSLFFLLACQSDAIDSVHWRNTKCVRPFVQSPHNQRKSNQRVGRRCGVVLNSREIHPATDLDERVFYECIRDVAHLFFDDFVQ